MDSLEYALRRINSFIDKISVLEECEFPYEDSNQALDSLKNHFNNRKKLLESFSDKYDRDSIYQECTKALDDLFIYLPLLGFILRSTNVRNAFEFYRPLLRLAKDILNLNGSNTNNDLHLILSSEWNYSPFTYKKLPALPEFILIGLPAHESENPLLIPLAGHELGHHIWNIKKYGKELEKRIETTIIDEITKNQWREYARIFSYLGLKKPEDFFNNLYTYQTWPLAKIWSLKQAEESFCDFVGLRIFGKSYLYAFAYLLAPNHSLGRSLGYPSMKNRVDNLMKAADVYNIDWDKECYMSMFNDCIPPALAKGEEFQLRLADNTIQTIAETLIDMADKIINLPTADSNELERIKNRFKKLVPAERCKSLVDILNAAWEFYEHREKDGTKLWEKDLSYIKPEEQDRIFEELILKNIEVFDFEKITNSCNDT